MTLRFYLIAMTLVAVLSDTLLHPFYPQFFETVYGVNNPKEVGYYFSAICFMVMLAFPFWAFVAKRIPELKILVYTQFAAGILATMCCFVQNYIHFWIISLIMLLFKGSYLLMYPYILRVSDKEKHLNTIGLLSVVVHFGSIGGALLGGIIIEFINPTYTFLIMALGDFVQMFVSLYILKNERFKANIHIEKDEETESTKLIPNGFILKLGILTLLLYFSVFVADPFFSIYWESISVYKSKIASGFVYSIPGIVALFVLWWNQIKNKEDDSKKIVIPILIGAVGLFLQASQQEGLVFSGRCIYGWAIFQSLVRLDVLLFNLSTPKSYAIDYSKVHFFQNLGVLIASSVAGILVDYVNIQMPFIIAVSGFIIVAGLYNVLLKKAVKPHCEKTEKMATEIEMAEII